MAIEKAPFDRTPGQYGQQLRMPGWVAAALAVGMVLLAASAGAVLMAEATGRTLQVQFPGNAGISVPMTADTVTVIGEGRVAAAPDTVYTDIGAEAQRATLAQSLSAAADDSARLTAALKSAGVAASDIQTTSMYTSTRTDQYGSVIGYSAWVNLRVRIRDVSKVTAILNAAGSSVGNDVRFGQLQYQRVDIAAQAPQARQAALASAQERASGIAKLSNRQLGKITSVEENFVGYLAAGTYLGGGIGAGGQGGGGGVPQISTGQGEVVVQLAVSYALN